MLTFLYPSSQRLLGFLPNLSLTLTTPDLSSERYVSGSPHVQKWAHWTIDTSWCWDKSQHSSGPRNTGFLFSKGITSPLLAEGTHGSPLTFSRGWHLKSTLTSRLLSPYSQVLAIHFKAPALASSPLLPLSTPPPAIFLVSISCYLHYSFLLSHLSWK